MSAVLEADVPAARIPARDAGADDALAATRTEWCLRIGAAACFIGHGAFGILTKDAWVAYFAIVGIGPDLAYAMMPIIGSVDIAAGILVLLSPRPFVLMYMATWGLWTALLRPLAGESFLETLERAGNYGVPFALILMFGVRTSARGMLESFGARHVAFDRALVGRVLLWTTVTMLFAHGALLAVTDKQLFFDLYAKVGVSATTARAIGIAEMAAAVLVLVAPVPALLIAVAVWKVASESLFPVSGAPIWELVERGGSYAAPVALVLLSGTSPFTRITFSRSSQ